MSNIFENCKQVAQSQIELFRKGRTNSGNCIECGLPIDDYRQRFCDVACVEAHEQDTQEQAATGN